jgi:hypothetical protein
MRLAVLDGKRVAPQFMTPKPKRLGEFDFEVASNEMTPLSGVAGWLSRHSKFHTSQSVE